jgi:hypothetical protein
MRSARTMDFLRYVHCGHYISSGGQVHTDRSTLQARKYDGLIVTFSSVHSLRGSAEKNGHNVAIDVTINRWTRVERELCPAATSDSLLSLMFHKSL